MGRGGDDRQGQTTYDMAIRLKSWAHSGRRNLPGKMCMSPANCTHFVHAGHKGKAGNDRGCETG